MQGDFEAFYLRHVRAIYRVCYAFMKNAQDAEDCTEDVFVKAMGCGIDFANERHERSWLTTTAMNLCKDRLKHWWHKKVVPLDAAMEETVAAPEENGSVLAAVLALPSGSWRAYWASGGVRYYVTNTDGADSAAVTTVTAALIAQNDAD